MTRAGRGPSRSSRGAKRRGNPSRRIAAFLVLVGIVRVAAVTGWVLMSGDVSAIASEVGASLSFGLQADPGEGDPPVDVVAPLRVSSEPEGARVIIDGREQGWTPLVVGVAPGWHALVLKHPDALDEPRRVDVPEDGTALSLQSWQRRASRVRLGPTYRVRRLPTPPF